MPWMCTKLSCGILTLWVSHCFSWMLHSSCRIFQPPVCLITHWVPSASPMPRKPSYAPHFPLLHASDPIWGLSGAEAALRPPWHSHGAKHPEPPPDEHWTHKTTTHAHTTYTVHTTHINAQQPHNTKHTHNIHFYTHNTEAHTHSTHSACTCIHKYLLGFGWDFVCFNLCSSPLVLPLGITKHSVAPFSIPPHQYLPVYW